MMDLGNVRPVFQLIWQAESGPGENDWANGQTVPIAVLVLGRNGLEIYKYLECVTSTIIL